MGCDFCKKRKVIRENIPKEKEEFKGNDDIETNLLEDSIISQQIPLVNKIINPNIEEEDKKAK